MNVVTSLIYSKFKYYTTTTRQFQLKRSQVFPTIGELINIRNDRLFYDIKTLLWGQDNKNFCRVVNRG